MRRTYVLMKDEEKVKYLRVVIPACVAIGIIFIWLMPNIIGFFMGGSMLYASYLFYGDYKYSAEQIKKKAEKEKTDKPL